MAFENWTSVHGDKDLILKIQKQIQSNFPFLLHLPTHQYKDSSRNSPAFGRLSPTNSKALFWGTLMEYYKNPFPKASISSWRCALFSHWVKHIKTNQGKGQCKSPAQIGCISWDVSGLVHYLSDLFSPAKVIIASSAGSESLLVKPL